MILRCVLSVLVATTGAAAAQAQERTASGVATAAVQRCEALASLTMSDVAITSSTAVPAGSFEPVPGTALAVPAFCRVQALATPSPDSRISIEVWLPAGEAWNKRFLGVGNGGFSGAIGYAAMASAVSRGYATAGTDTGHVGDDMQFGRGHPERIIDWAYRSVHITAAVGKLVVRSHYDRFPAWSYFNGCSTGGQQALSEAQRYPGDYDGIVAGAPGNNRIRLILGFLWGWQASHRDDGTRLLEQNDLDLVARAVIDACDAGDGVRDGILARPAGCHFDPSALACRATETTACLTLSQVEAVRKIYGGARHARTGAQLFPGWTRGSERGWATYLTGPREPVRVGFFRHLAFHDPAWSPKTFDWDKDVAFVESQVPYLSAVSLDYTAFRNRGAKLLMYTGLADPVVPSEDPRSHYDGVVAQAEGVAQAQEFFRYFEAPGMAHCRGGDAPDAFDTQAAIEAWVERGVAPTRIVATQGTSGKTRRTRPLCPYPQVATYRGAGSPDDEASFVCAN
jgi:feruloyl esterase